jgi:hypothetical protein
MALPACGCAASTTCADWMPHATQTCPDWLPYAIGGLVLPVGFLVGLVFMRIIGVTANFVYWGGAIGFMVALVNGEWLRAPGFLLVMLAGYVLAIGQRTRADVAADGGYQSWWTARPWWPYGP